ncbi:MAG: class I adenylate-forming enzyme family protein [Lapillicoccus sp.]
MSLLVGDLLDRGLRSSPSACAATLGDDAVSYLHLDRAAAGATAALAELGVRRGDLVAWWTAPSFAGLAGFLACARLGAVFAPLPPRATDEEMAAALGVLRPVRLVADDPRQPRAERLADPATVVPWALLTRPAPDSRPPGRVAEDDPHIAYLTSGSTGRPKAALVSHRASWLRSAPGGGTFSTPLRGDGGIVCTFPLYHYGGWHYVMEAWLSIRPVHLVDRPDAALVVDAVERWRPSAIYCIPAVWERLLDPAFAHHDLSSLRHCDTGTSAVSADLVRRIKARVPGSTTSILYGSTEAGRMAALPDWEHEQHPGSVGRAAFPGSLWLDPDGEVCVSTPAMMSGYLGDPEATEAVLRDGVYRSGDVGVLDDDGYLTLVGRSTELIRTGGEFVAPVEVETALRSHPGVADVAVVGVADPLFGQRVCAVVVPRGTPGPTLQELRDHTAGRLSAHKQPRRLELVVALPRTSATGQVRRAEIRQRLESGDDAPV